MEVDPEPEPEGVRAGGWEPEPEGAREPQPLVWTKWGASFSIGGLPGDELDPSVVKVDEYKGTRSALALPGAPMTHGVHYADFHILCANTFKRSPTVPRVGVAQADHDAAGMWAASDLPLGWGWTYSGVVWHDGLDWGEPLGEAYTWGAGDVLRLRLDMDAGVLAGGKNGGPLTVLASGLKGHEFGRDAREQELRCELCWSVDMEAPGCAIRIERGEKRSDDSVPDQLNEGNHMPPDWEEDK